MRKPSPSPGKSVAIAALVAALGTSTYLALTFRNRAEAGIRFEAAIVRRDAGLPLRGALDAEKASVAIRDWVYRGFRVKDDALPDAEAPIRYAALSSAQSTMLCGGAAEAYEWALETVGIPARIVQLAGQAFLDGRDSGDTHVAVEVEIGGKWVYSDPTYNVSVRCGAGLLSTAGIRACLDEEGPAMVVHGPSLMAERPVPTDYFHYFAAYDVRDGDEFPRPDWLEEALEKYPQR